MFFRIKQSGPRGYLQIVENKREAGAVRQTVIATLGRVWEETGCQAVLGSLLAERMFEFPLERAVFATVLHRIMLSGSDRACERWIDDYDIPGAGNLALHHLYRAMAWLGEELPKNQQKDATPFGRRTIKDLIEEALFARRRDLFSELSVVFH